MTHTLCYKRLCAALLALMLAVAGSLAAGAVGAAAGGGTAPLPLAVTFWGEDSEGYSEGHDRGGDGRGGDAV